MTPSPTALRATPAPASLESVVFDYLVDIVGDGVFEFGTPQNKAANWLIYDDPSSLVAQLPLVPPAGTELDPWGRVLQRFLMAFFYYAHSSNGFLPWLSCNPPDNSEFDTGSDPSACIFQMPIALLEEQVQYSPVRAVRWLSIAHECDWQGVSCHVIGSEEESMRAVDRITMGTFLAS